MKQQGHSLQSKSLSLMKSEKNTDNLLLVEGVSDFKRLIMEMNEVDAGCSDAENEGSSVRTLTLKRKSK